MGMSLLTGLMWVAASSSWRIVDWLADEWTFGCITVLLAAAAAWFAALSTWRQVLLGTVLALVVHFCVFFVPLIILMDYPVTRYLFEDVLEAMIPYAGAFAIALTLVFLFQTRKADMKGQP